MQEDLKLYFPTPLRKKYAKAIGNHRLSREIIASGSQLVDAAPTVDQDGGPIVSDPTEAIPDDTGEDAGR